MYLTLRPKPGKFCLYNPDSEKFCPRHLESWALKCSIRWGISPSHFNGWNPESKFHWQRLEFGSLNSESTTWNAKSKTVLDSFRPVSNVVLLLCRTQFINYKYIRIHLEVCLTVSLLLWFFFGNSRSIDWIKFDVWNQVHCSSKSCPGWGEGGYSWEFLVGVCRLVPQTLTRFQTKKCNFPHPSSD